MKYYFLAIFMGVYAFAKAQSVDAQFLTNIKHGATTSISDVTAPLIEGTIIYDSPSKQVYAYDGTQWRRIYYAPIVAPKTANYTLTSQDDGNVITFNSATNVTLTVPAGLPIGFNISIYQIGTGQVTITGAGGVAVRNRLSRFVTAGINAGAGIISTATNVYHVSGDLKR